MGIATLFFASFFAETVIVGHTSVRPRLLCRTFEGNQRRAEFPRTDNLSRFVERKILLGFSHFNE